MSLDQSNAIILRNVRRNLTVNVLDGAAFIFGISMVSRYTVLPLVIEHLSSERWLQGLTHAIFYAGWLIPGLFMAPVVASMARRKPWIMFATLWERLPYLVLGLVLLTMPDLPHNTLLVILFSLYAVYALGSGLTSTAWQDFIARLIPERLWGTFFGVQSGLGGVLGVGSGLLAGYMFATQPFPQNFGLLSLTCFGFMVLSYIFLGLNVEPPQATAPRERLVPFLRGIGPLLKRDNAFRIYLLCRSAIAFGFTGHGFLTAAALERFHPPATQVGIFTGVLLAAQAIANVLLGILADRWGHKQVLELSTIMGLAALGIALIAPSALWFIPIFILVGAAQAGYQLAGFTLVFAFSTPVERPTYIGVANTALAPVAALGPLLAGWLASATNYNTIFGILALIGLVGLAVLHWRVTAPVRVIMDANP